jgi:hypothetical protein
MTDLEYMIEGATRDLTVMLMERKGMKMTVALDTLYNSETYQKLSDPRSGLYFQSPGYVYDFLEKEIQYGKMR